MKTYVGAFSRLTRCWTLLPVAIVAMLMVRTVSADEKRWFPGQFIVTLKSNETEPPIASIQSTGTDSEPITLKTLSGGALVVAPGLSGSVAVSSLKSSPPQSIPYQGDEGFCENLLTPGSKYASCSPNYEVKISGTPNDPLFANASLWGLNGSFGISAPRAWDRSTGTSDVVVAVIDTGLDYTHPDLAQNAWTNVGEIPGNGQDDDGNGYVDDVHGINTIIGSGDPMDDNSHGTHVSGTIGAVGNNILGVVGINWHVRIMGLKFLNAAGAGALSDAIEAIDYMILMKNRYGVNIKVANNSWGGGGFSQPLAEAIERANTAGIIFTAAAGNEANDNDLSPSYPAGYSFANVVPVAAIDKDGNLASFSNFGQSSVAIAAPGVGIVSTVLQGGYASYSGTSMATPHVTGALALLFASEPTLDMQSAINRVYESGVQLQSLSTVVRTSRTLNVGRMLANETAPLPAPPPALEPCHYQIREIPFGPDSNVTSASVLQRADEGSFATVNLPWEVSLYRTKVRSVSVSPNGVIYLRNPGTIDFQNGARAPSNSIAALHTDLISEASDLQTGLRYSSTQDAAWFFWRAKHYHAREAGYVNVWAALYRDGRIQIFTKFDDSTVTAAAQQQATIGTSGSDAASSDTFAYNSSVLHSEMGVEFVPLCDQGSGGAGSTVTVSKITATSASKGKPIKAGGTVRLTMQGEGTGDITLQGSIDGFQCAESKSIRIVQGEAFATSALPRNVARSVTFTVGSVKKTIRLRKTNSRARVNAVRAAKACDQLFAKLE